MHLFYYALAVASSRFCTAMWTRTATKGYLKTAPKPMPTCALSPDVLNRVRAVPHIPYAPRKGKGYLKTVGCRGGVGRQAVV